MSENLNRRILIIDDNRAIHDDFRKILSTRDAQGAYEEVSADLFGEGMEKREFDRFEVESAFQGREGLEMVKQALAADRPYGVAFVDVRMPPGWDGIETIGRLWQVCPELQAVICTAYSDYSWDEIATRLGHNDGLLILKKPFDSVEVLQLAQTLTRKWTLARQARLHLADLNAVVTQRTRELRKSNEQLEQFSILGSRLSAARSIREAGQIIVDAADRVLGWDACLMDLYSPETNLLTQVLNADLVGGQRQESVLDPVQRPPSPLARKALQEGGQLMLKSDLTRMRPDGEPFGDTTRPSASIMFVPIRNGKAVTGLVSIQSYTPNAYDRCSLETMQALADHCGGALDRVRTEEALRGAQEQLRQSQKLEAIGQLAGGVAHDFNNLLAVIQGNADLMRMDSQGFTDEANQCLNQITAASERAANLTRQLLTFSRKQMMRSQPIDLNDVVANLTKMLKRLIGENIDLQCHYASGLALVQADVGMLEQVLVNLVVNARDAMADGGQLLITTEQVTLETGGEFSHPDARPGDFVCMTVKDNGAGIPPENLSRIFDPFFTTKELGKGTGLGLATVYGIVRQHQGWIEVSSQMGSGSTFRIFLAALKCGGRVSSDPVEPAQPPGGTETVLLVEDEASLRSVTRLCLERYGYRVLEAGSGPEALKVWEAAATKIDLLLTDLIMPEGMTGRQLAEELRRRKAGLKIIFVSGYSGDVLGKEGEFLRQTNSYFLHKPCGPPDLLSALRRCLDGLPA